MTVCFCRSYSFEILVIFCSIFIFEDKFIIPEWSLVLSNGGFEDKQYISPVISRGSIRGKENTVE